MIDVFERIVAIVDAAVPVDAPKIPKTERGTRPPKRRRVERDSKSIADEPPDGPRSFGYSVERLNEEDALVKFRGHTVVFQNNPGARLGEPRMRVLGIDGFKAWLCRPASLAGNPAHLAYELGG